MGGMGKCKIERMRGVKGREGKSDGGEDSMVLCERVEVYVFVRHMDGLCINK